MKYSILSAVVVFLFIHIQDVVPNDRKLQKETDEVDQFNINDSADFSNDSPRSKHTNTHFLFQMHDAINSLHAYYFAMLRNENFVTEQYGTKPNISHRCIEGLKDFSIGLREKRLWALMMVDSCGKIPSGILEGNFYSTGDFDQCIDSEAPGKFKGQHCEVGVTHNINFQHQSGDPMEPMDLTYIHETNQSKVWEFDDKFPNGVSPVTTSLCFPSTCSIEEVKFLVSKVSSDFEETLKIGVSKCIVKSQRQYTSGEKLGMTLVIVIIVLEIMATVLHIRWNALQGNNAMKIETSLLKKAVLCLSLRTHFIKFFKRSSISDSVEMFNGLKVATNLYVIYYHDYYYRINYFTQLKQLYKYLTSFPAVILQAGGIENDTFFFMSGYLILYNYTKYGHSSYSILKRYLRLWIPVLFVFVSSFFFLNMSQGPMWTSSVEQSDVENRHTWWRNALCINNFAPFSKQFLPWTWYLGVDMQLSIAAHFILLIYRRNPSKAMRIVKVITVFSLFFLAFRQYYYRYPPLRTTFTKFSIDGYLSQGIHIHTSYHIAPFCVGMLTCHVISTTRDVQIPKVVKILGWFLFLALTIICRCVPYIWNSYRAATTIESVVFGSLQRFLWSLVLAWMTFVYCKKEGGILTSLLSWKDFSYLSDLTYSSYLIQSPLFRFRNGLARSRYSLSLSSHIASSLVVIIVTYALAFICHLVCEAPLNSLLSLLLPSSRGRKEIKKTL